MRVLLIWNEVPEEVKFVEIVNPTEEQLKTLMLANGSYINSVDLEEGSLEEEAVNCINLALASPGDYPIPDGIPNATHYEGIWVNNIIAEKDLPHAGAFDQVFSCGFFV